MRKGDVKRKEIGGNKKKRGEEGRIGEETK